MVRGATITNSDNSIPHAKFEGLIPLYIVRQQAEEGNIIEESSVKVIHTVPIRSADGVVYKVLWTKNS